MLYAIDEPFEIALKEPIVGARWQLIRSDFPINVLEERLIAAKGSAPGEPALRVFTLVAHKSGEYELCFELKRVRDPTPLSRHLEQVSIVER